MTERMCIVSREVKPVDELVRFVLSPDQAVVPDIKCDLPGRGVWVSADRSAVETAVTKRAFGRGFKAQASADETLPDLVGRLLERRALALLSLAKKAGLVRSGFGKVVKLIESGRAAAVVHASDAAEDGRRKIGQKITAAYANRSGPQTVSVFTSEDLSLALGLPNVIHAAITDARLTQDFVRGARKCETIGVVRRGTGRCDRQPCNAPLLGRKLKV